MFVRRLFTPGAPLPIGPVPIAGRVALGRARGGPVQLDGDARASREHAVLHVTGTPPVVAIEDRSANGTFVNGRRVTRGAVGDGDVIRLGDTFVLVRVAHEPHEPEIGGLWGDAPSMHALRRGVRLVAPTDAMVLVQGESGTGKELVARAIHAGSGRAGPLVALNCGAIPEGLAESHLFGHVAGAFTGARGDAVGYFRAASGGVLLLDEIGELPLGLQAMLLRVLEERAVTPVGATRSVPCDVRVVAATHRDLRRDVGAGRFRGDLYARLAELTLATPPLRERREDVLGLVHRALPPGTPPLAPDLVEALLTYAWPYNVRELLKVSKELAIRSSGHEVVELELVADRLRPVPSERSIPAAAAAPPSSRRANAAPRALPERGVPSRDVVLALLREHRGVIADVARATARSRKQVYRWLEAYALDAEDFREPAASER